jgi:triphosphoribosyl-dephospho-CoA synthetase
MVSDLDIWRSAHLVIEKHGEEAELAAALRADELLAKGDVEGERTWRRILAAIVKLQTATGPTH